MLHGKAQRGRQEAGQRPTRRYAGTVANPSELWKGGREPGRYDGPGMAAGRGRRKQDPGEGERGQRNQAGHANTGALARER
eukprot:8609895-Pyramimonas_sp.AAC.1